jgi:hypothetical protein
MWRRIRLCVTVLLCITLIAIATAQAVQAWKTNEGLGQQDEGGGNDCSAQVTAAQAMAASKCAPGDLSCQVQQQAEIVARLQVTVSQLNTVANEALTKANKAAEASVNIGKAAQAHHQARQAAASAAAAPLSGLGAAPLSAPPASKGDITAMTKQQ